MGEKCDMYLDCEHAILYILRIRAYTSTICMYWLCVCVCVCFVCLSNADGIRRWAKRPGLFLNVECWMWKANNNLFSFLLLLLVNFRFSISLSLAPALYLSLRLTVFICGVLDLGLDSLVCSQTSIPVRVSVFFLFLFFFYFHYWLQPTNLHEYVLR